MINGVMKPTVTSTAAMVTDSDKAIAQLLKMKKETKRRLQKAFCITRDLMTCRSILE